MMTICLFSLHWPGRSCQHPLYSSPRFAGHVKFWTTIWKGDHSSSLTINLIFFWEIERIILLGESDSCWYPMWYTYNLTFSKREKHFTIGPTFSEWNHSEISEAIEIYSLQLWPLHLVSTVIYMLILSWPKNSFRFFFPHDLSEKSKWTFWLTQYVTYSHE